VNLDIFDTDLGWMVILGGPGGISGADLLRRVLIGFATERAAWEAGERTGVDCRRTRRWNPRLVEQLRELARGVPQAFDEVELDLEPYGEFTREVLAACRQIRWGETRTYGELAAICGAPRAARAVGNVMAANRFPLIVPCHRVVAANGRLGGFSAPQGVALKRRLLRLERQPVFA
jgi:methylated-DNA-[protein]-cysteine S-methyltransferase